MGTLMDMELPKHWMIVQQLATVDATTFDMYLANMRTMVMEQLFQADVVIFNRCDDSTDKGKYRRNVKALNRKAQLVYERADGTLDERPEELPFDITADEIEISDADYAIWYMDCQENPKKYEGKKVSFLALVYNPDKLKKGIMVPGRFAMTCCVEDVTFIGFKTKYDREDEIPHKSWINITAEVHVEFAKEYKGKGPVLYPISVTPAEKPGYTFTTEEVSAPVTVIEYCLCINGIATDIYNKPLYKFPDYNSAFQYGMYCKRMGYLVSIFKINNGFIDPFCTNL